MFCSDSTHMGEPPDFQEPYLHEVHDGVEVWWVRTLKYSSARSLRRMLSWLHFEWRLLRMPTRNIPRPNVVIASSLSPLCVLSGLYFCYRFKAKFVFEVRDIWPLILCDGGGYSRWNPFILALGAIEKMGYRCADLIVGTMPNLGAHIRRRIGKEKAVVCIPMGVDSDSVNSGLPLPEGFHEKYLSSGRFLVCHAGSIGTDNALDTLFSCASSMVDDKRVHFLIVGDGYLKEEYMQRFGGLPNVQFAPRISKESVGALLAKCDLLYFATHDSEALKFGQSLNKLVDYMLSGTPVLGSYSGFPSMINEAQSGIFVPACDVAALKDAIEGFVGMDEIERRRMGARGRAWILQNRDYRTLASNYCDAICRLFPAEVVSE
jgi:glycosyltransferase involved in cell wall biosynthesis